MQFFQRLILLLGITVMPAACLAQSYILFPLNLEVAADAQPYPDWINDKGDIVVLTSTQTQDAPYFSYLLSGGTVTPLDDANGYYFDVDNRGDLLGLTSDFIDGLYKPKVGSILQLAYPGASFTSTYGFNNRGTIVGSTYFSPSQAITPAFWYSDQTINTYNYPGAKGYAFTTYLYGVNDRGDMVGNWIDEALYSSSQTTGQSGEFVVINLQTKDFKIDGQQPGDVFVPYQINNSDIIAGTMTIQKPGVSITYMGYVYDHGKSIKIDYSRYQPLMIKSGATKLYLQRNSSTSVYCINNSNVIVGSWSGTYSSTDGSVTQNVMKPFIGRPFLMR